ncbi:MAG: hypothetical protein QXQ66_07245 [Candidatus Hadarchaeum sp.]
MSKITQACGKDPIKGLEIHKVPNHVARRRQPVKNVWSVLEV